MLKQETVQWLAKVPALDLIPDEELERLAGIVTLEYYPRGTRILEQQGEPAQSLYLIKKGGVKVFVGTRGRGEMVIDYRTEADYFGLISVISGDPPRAGIVAVEDTLCYRIPRDEFRPLLARHPDVSDTLLKSYFTHFIDKTHAETRKRIESPSNGHQRLFSAPLRDLARSEPVTVTRETSIRETARRMVETRAEAVIVVDDHGAPGGIVTDRDLRQKVVARGLDADRSVSEVMSAPIITAGGDEPCSAALFKMMQHGIHHILVVEGGSPRGVVSDRDFLVSQGAAPTMLISQIQSAGDAAGLAAAAGDVRSVVATMAREGARGFDIAEVITRVADKLVERAGDFLEDERGGRALPFSVFALGAAGRTELTLGMRVDLGIVLAEPSESWVSRFVESLAAIGPTGSVFRVEPDNVLSLEEWRERLSSSAEAALAWADIRVVRGDPGPVDELREEVVRRVSDSPQLRAAASASALRSRPPLGFFRRFVVDKDGEHRDEFDLLEKGVGPLVDAIRVLAVERRCDRPSTRERIELLGQAPAVPHSDELEPALEYMLTLLIHQQVAAVEAGNEPDGFVNPEQLTHVERRTLKEAFQLASSLLELLRRRNPAEGEP